MKMNPVLWSLLLLLLLSCSKDENAIPADRLQVEISVVGGMCGSGKRVVIDKKQTQKFVQDGGCNGRLSISETATDRSTFEQLNRHLKKLDLFSRKIDECARCADGVDYLVNITNGGDTTIQHSISFQNDDKDVRKFLDFIDKL